MNRTRHRWRRLTGWTIPLAYALGTFAVAMVFPRLEYHFLPGWVSTMSAASAMAVCSAIASGMIALTGIVFSLTFVMVQFSATAYSPRLVLWVAREPVMSHALGVFTATFLYALGMLSWVDRNAEGRVPYFSTWLVVLLLLASMAMFVALIERVGMLQVNRMLIFTGDQARASIEEIYGAHPSNPPSCGMPDLDRRPVIQTLTHSGRPKALQALDLAALVDLAAAGDAVIEMTAAVGNTLMDRAPLLRVRGGQQPLDEAALRRAIQHGDERTFEQDPEYAIRLVVDIAIKALSPAINDPTTAVQALDQIEDVLLRIGRCNLENGIYADRRGQPRLLTRVPTWDNFLLLALDEIRAYGADSVQVMRRMKALIKNLTEVLPADRQPALRRWEQRLQGSIARSFDDAQEKRDASVADRQGLGGAPDAPKVSGVEIENASKDTPSVPLSNH